MITDLTVVPLDEGDLPDCERIAATCRHFVAAYDEFGADPSVMGFELACLEAALAGESAPRDEDSPR